MTLGVAIPADAAAALVAVGALLLLLAEWRGMGWLRALAKPAASLGFVLLAVSRGALGSRYGTVILAGLVLSALGDGFLLSDRRRAFLLGLGAFFLAHLTYVGAFFLRGLAPAWTLVFVAVLTVPRYYVLRWLLPHVSSDGMRRAVTLYASVLSIMLAAAGGTWVEAPDWRIGTGALLFYLSDLAVARQRFVTRALPNKLLGLPTYYGGQVLLALSVG